MSNESILLTQIIEGDRARDSKKYGNLEGLISSLKSIGSIQPIVLSATEGNRYHLVAGGRRFRALKAMGVTTIFHHSVLNPEKFGYVFEKEVPEHVRLEAELDENLHRLDMDWIDNVLLIAKVHAAKKSVNPKWGVRQTAELLPSGGDKTAVSLAIRIAKRLREGDKTLREAKNMSEAISIMVKEREEAALAELQKRVTPKVSAPAVLPALSSPATAVGSAMSFLTGFSMDLGEKKDVAELQSKTGLAPSSTPLELPPKVQVPLSVMFRHGDWRDITPSLPDASFDHIVTDIPYGIDMDNLDDSLTKDVREQHDVDQNIDMMKPFLIEAFRLVKSGGFCVFFYDLDHHEKLQTWATEVGWRVQAWPFIACKSSVCKNQSPQYNTTKNYEVAMFLRKDSQTVLRKPVTSSWNTYDFAAERKLYNNPFAKPFALWKDIYDMIAFPGQSVADFYAGEMSACRAAANCGLVPYGFEIGQNHYLRGLEHMKAVYALIHKSNVEFV